MEGCNDQVSQSTESICGEINVEPVEIRFAEFCKVLFVDEKQIDLAAKVLKETKHILRATMSSFGGLGSPEEAEKYWFSFVCYVVGKLSIKNKESEQSMPISLCQMLKLAKISISDFFKDLTSCTVAAGPVLREVFGENWESNLKAMESHANFVQMRDLSRLYKRSFNELFISRVEKSKEASLASDGPDTSKFYRFGWLLFLSLRIRIFVRFKDLVACTNALVSILGILILHVPTHFRSFSLADSQWLVRKGESGINILASLCNKYELAEDELKSYMEKTNDLISEILKAGPSKFENINGIDGDGLVHYEGLIEEPWLDSRIETLEKDYESADRTESDLDERVYITDDELLLASSSSNGEIPAMAGTKRKLHIMSSPSRPLSSPLSPFRSPASHANSTPSKMLSTPVSLAMSTAKWLRTVVSPLPSCPSAKLQQFMSSCDKDMTEDIMRRAEIILEAIFPTSPSGERCVAGSLQSTNPMDNMWAKQRKLEALKLYLRVLEAMCVAESQIANASNLTALLTNERFHRCMLACSAELVLVTHKTVTLLFPTVLERTGITAFDLSKVIESFIRHEETLPRELRRHLNSLEERLLESMVWEKGSSMYNSLIIAKPSLSEIHRLDLMAEPMPSLDSIAAHINFSGVSSTKEDNTPQNGGFRSPKRQCHDFRSALVERNPFTSPVKDRFLPFNSLKSKLPPPAPLQSAFTSPSRRIPGSGETFAETAINVFFSKINKLAAVRISGIAERLQKHQHIRENVYRLFSQILTHQTSLFFNRHIDQIILCCFYGIAKISKVNLTFKEIINNYRKQPQCKPQVFRCVYVGRSCANHPARSGHDHVEIITFYNEVFIPAAKPLLVEVGAAEVVNKSAHVPEGPCPSSPRVSPFPTLPDMSPKKVSAVHNVYVSPLRTSKIDALISHSSKSYYACVGESTHAYQSPSKDLSDINVRLNGSRKVRGALKFDESEGGLVSDSMVASTLLYDRRPVKSEKHVDSN